MVLGQTDLRAAPHTPSWLAASIQFSEDSHAHASVVKCCDVFQGHSRRLQVCVNPVQNSGTLPLLVEAVLSVSIGCVSARSTKLQRALDSYQVCGVPALTPVDCIDRPADVTSTGSMPSHLSHCWVLCIGAES